jgi:hypothetical protein
MSRYVRIRSAAFDGLELPLPLSVRLLRGVQTAPLTAEARFRPSSVQIVSPVLNVEVRIRATAVAETLEPGRSGQLLVTVLPSVSMDPVRLLRLDTALLLTVELQYKQSNAATATLRFVGESPDGEQAAFTAEDEA